ncbi:MAG: trimethylamine methyltransferase family protein [Kiritimatiellae bacterium]|nr:trimethylamine methyltransferase family protein [Kiritimatiellia bacterium]
MIAKLLTPQQIERIHEVSLTILHRVGIVVPHEEILSRFADCGAEVNPGESRVRIPPRLVTELVGKAGRQFTLYGRDESRTAPFGFGCRNYNSIAGEAQWIDEIGGNRRFPSLEDVAAAARCGDALDSITIAGAMADPHELPVEWRSVAVVATLIRNTTKPVTFWFHDRASARYIVDMLVALRGGEQAARERPLFYPFLEPISPLRFPFNGVDLLFETARLNLPVPVGPMAQMGLSAPCTVAGTMAQENAEILAGICITQLVRAGMPVCYGGICHAFDMRSTQLIFCGPEQALFGVGLTEMGKHYGLPVYINVGLTDSKRPDAQAGLETGVTLALGAAAGADIFGHMGICGVDQATSLDMLVLQDEVIAYVESTLREIDFSDEAFGLEEIGAAGPGGTFIDSMHTAQHFRRELWFPKILDREYYRQWQEAGAKSTEQRCRERREQLLASHQPQPVSDALDRVLDEIVDAASSDLGRDAA